MPPKNIFWWRYEILNDKNSKFAQNPGIAKIGDCLDDLRLSDDCLSDDCLYDDCLSDDCLDDLRLSVVQLKQDFRLVEKLCAPATVFTSNKLVRSVDGIFPKSVKGELLILGG